MMSTKLKLAEYVIKRYEPSLGLYFFYNAKDDTVWETDFHTGSIISALDGTITTKEVFEILSKNNNIPIQDIESAFSKSLDYLKKEGFLNVKN